MNDQMDPPQVRSCGVIVLRREPTLSFLLMRHANRWDLPKGHVDDGETDLQCAMRELEEESGITKHDIELDPTFRFVHQYDVRDRRHPGVIAKKTLVIFLGWLTRNVEISVTEHGGYEWFEWQPPHRIQPQTIDPLLERVAEHLVTQSH